MKRYDFEILYTLSLALPAGVAMSLAIALSLAKPVEEQEILAEWVASVIEEDGDEVIIVDSGCTEEVQDGSVLIKAPCEAVPEKEVITVSYESGGKAIGPINVSMPDEPNVGWLTKDMGEHELRDILTGMGFRNLAGMREAKLRQLLVVYNYEPFFWRIHERTGLPVSVICAYFIIEATSQGVESELLRAHYNPGGVKYRGIGDVAYSYDDCYDVNGKKIPCRFESLAGYEQMEKVWSGVFNKQRYSRCKTYSTVEEICKCLYESGYHTGNNWKLRARLAKRYWLYRSKFPRPSEFLTAK